MNKFHPQEQLTGFGELMLIVTRNTMAKVGQLTLDLVDRAQDCWGEDSIEDQEIKSEIWNRNNG